MVNAPRSHTTPLPISPTQPSVWEDSIATKFSTASGTTPTPSTSSPPRFHFIRYKKHLKKQQTIVPLDLVFDPTVLKSSFFVLQKPNKIIINYQDPRKKIPKSKAGLGKMSKNLD